MSHGEIIGQIPSVIQEMSTFTQACRVGAQTRRQFLDLVTHTYRLFQPFSRFLPTEEELLKVAGQAYDKFFME